MKLTPLRLLSWLALLCFSGTTAIAAGSSTNALAPDVPRLFLIGDSTVNNGTKGQQGWGSRLGEFFDPAKLQVVNRARGGRSSRTYFTEGLWSNVVAELRPGDFVLMQFGHNDSGPLDTERARASLKGTGEESRVVTNQVSGKVETVYTYGWYLRRYLADAQAKGAPAIVCSLVPRNLWKDGKVVRGRDSHGGWAAEVAQKEGVPFLDLNEIIAQRYESLGEEKVKGLFPADHTHTNPDGARLNAEMVVAGLKALTNCPLRDCLGPKAAGVPAP